MNQFPELLQDAIDQLSRIPGVGKKTATRYALFLTSLSSVEIREISQSIQGLNEIQVCQQCHSYSDHAQCEICSDESRKSSKSICVVENYLDFLAIENSRYYQGQYHILGGVLNPLMGVGPEQLTINKLISRIKDGISEVVLAINPSVEGDATSSFIREEIKKCDAAVSVKRIGLGVPAGGNLEYLDSMTISKALENKHIMQ